MGGPAASHNNFWQLFVRPAGTTTWRLATPPGVASNGGLVITGLGTGPVVAGFRPSQDLSYSPLATTRDNGTAWTPQPARRRPRRRPRRSRRRPRRRPPARATRQRRSRTRRPRRNDLAETGHPPGSRRIRRGHPVRRAAFTAAAFSPAGAPMLAASVRPPRHRRHLRRHQPDLARRRARRCPPTLAHASTITVLRLASRRRHAPPRCWRPAPAQPPACSPPGPPTAAPTGPCPRHCRSTARRSRQRPPGPIPRWRSC